MSKKDKDDPVWSILPSYYMYQTTFYGELDPPQYDENDIAADVSTNDNTDNSTTVASNVARTTGTAATPALSFDDPRDLSSDSIIVADESTTTWRETILDNIHQLRNMTHSDNPAASSLKIDVYFTAEVGEVGKAPTHVDPLNFEYKQGDFLNGYVLIRNTGSKPIPFDMFYVLFEGNFIVANKADVTDLKPVKIRKFLEMYDFAASWNQALVKRLLCETENEPAQYDPIDGARLCMGMTKKVAPGALYKRFFTFKIPERLLDSECYDHNLPGHTELPPTLGLSRMEQKYWKNAHSPVDDLLFIDTATSYGVLARFIGKARKYGWEPAGNAATRLINAEGDEFVILKELVSHVRILQELLPLSERERSLAVHASRVMYQNFVQRIEECLAVGNELKKAISEDPRLAVDIAVRTAAETAVRTRNDVDKTRQLYLPCEKRPRDQVYRIMLPLTKNNVFGKKKILGTFLVETPASEYLLNYIPPQRFRYGQPVDDTAWQVQVPIEVGFTPCNVVDKNGVVPYIRDVSAEFIVFTLKSNNRPIPVELTHDLLFRNGTSDSNLTHLAICPDNFTHLVKRPLTKYAKELYKLVDELGVDNFRVEKSLVEDLSAMSHVEEKYNNLVLHDVKVVDALGQQFDLKKCIKVPLGDGPNHTRRFSVCVDIAKALKKRPNQPGLKPGYKSYDEFTLVPSFQTCLLVRMYYLRMKFYLLTDQVVEVKVPVSIGKMPTN